MRFKDKSVIVTGGAGGVGRALVRLFSREGRREMIADVLERGCQEIQAEMAEAGYRDWGLKRRSIGLPGHLINKS